MSATCSSSSLVDRLRGIYTMDVNDGAGPLNGKDTFTRKFEGLPPINEEAAKRIEELEEQLSEASTSIPPEVLDLVRFMCSTWHEIDEWAHRNAGEAITSYPVIQGTSNQLNLIAIGEQKYDSKSVAAAVEWMKKQ